MLSMLIGYARVSTIEQNVTLQIDELEKAGCEQIFRDKVSGAKTERPGLHEALDFLRKGDTFGSLATGSPRPFAEDTSSIQSAS